MGAKKKSPTDDILVTRLTEQINAKIMSGAYPPGSRLRQELIAAEFSVSRTPVREALRQLEVRGVVQHLPNQSAIVRAPTAREIRNAYQIRAELEGLAVELAVASITDEQIRRLKSAHQQLVEIVDRLPAAGHHSGKANGAAGWVDANDAFHDVILEACKNRRLRQAITDMHAGFIRNVMLSAIVMNGRQMREYVAQHEAIIAAVERHDPVEARRVMTHHVKRSGELVIRSVENRDGAG